MRTTVKATHAHSGSMFALTQLKVLDTVVRAITVNVMHCFCLFKFAPEMLSHHLAMLHLFITITDADKNVSILPDYTPPAFVVRMILTSRINAPCSFTRARAVILLVRCTPLRSPALEIFTAAITRKRIEMTRLIATSFPTRT